MLSELLYIERKLLDGWDKNVSIYCIEDWPYFQRYRENAHQWYGNENRPAVKILSRVRDALKKQGPLSSIDLDFNEVVGWSWSPTRISRAALESMYSWGELIIHHKINTRKVYDFASHHIPETILHTPDPNTSIDQFFDWIVLRRIGSIGLLWNKSGSAWLGIHGLKSKQRLEALQRLSHQKKIHKIRISNIDVPFYIRNRDLRLLKDIIPGIELKPFARIIAPLDNLIWDREMIKELFGFEYRWEVYKPVSEREYGYYVLPILYKDRFIARFEPGHDKKNKVLIIKEFWWEHGIKKTKTILKEIKKCFKRFMQYLGADTLKIECPGLENFIRDQGFSTKKNKAKKQR